MRLAESDVNKLAFTCFEKATREKKVGIMVIVSFEIRTSHGEVKRKTLTVRVGVFQDGASQETHCKTPSTSLFTDSLTCGEGSQTEPFSAIRASMVPMSEKVMSK